MAANSFPTGTPVPKQVRMKTATVARTDTTAKQLFTLPKTARLVDVQLYATVASNAVTTATVGVGSTTGATEFVNNADVKTAAGLIRPTTLMGGLYATATSDVAVYGKYAETGGASNNGAWKVTLFYSTGNITNDDTL